MYVNFRDVFLACQFESNNNACHFTHTPNCYSRYIIAFHFFSLSEWKLVAIAHIFQLLVLMPQQAQDMCYLETNIMVFDGLVVL